MLFGLLQNVSTDIVAWVGFGLLVFLLVTGDLLLLHRKERDPSLAESAITVALWCALAVAFGGLVWWWKGSTSALQFCTGYVVEWSMSLDNVFVFAIVFRYFQVPKRSQYRVLFWGIMGAIVMRLAFILAGAALIARFHFVLPLFGLFLIYSAFQLARHSGEPKDPRQSLVFRLARRWLPLSKDPAGVLSDDDIDLPPVYGSRFFQRQEGRLCVTPLFLVLLVIESSDVLFAVDSVPAIFGITRDPFIVFTSNIFAILGLRALYFLLAGVMDMFRYLHYGLAAVLGFVGVKMVAEAWWPHAEGSELVPSWASLLVIAAIIGATIFISMVTGPQRDPHSPTDDSPAKEA